MAASAPAPPTVFSPAATSVSQSPAAIFGMQGGEFKHKTHQAEILEMDKKASLLLRDPVYTASSFIVVDTRLPTLVQDGPMCGLVGLHMAAFGLIEAMLRADSTNPSAASETTETLFQSRFVRKM